MVCYIYKETLLNIHERACVGISFNSVDTEPMMLVDKSVYCLYNHTMKLMIWSDSYIGEKLIVIKHH